jgi:hypothetical protein
MNKVLSGIDFSAVIKPGDIYVLSNQDKGYMEVESYYFIRDVDELVEAIEAKYTIICAAIYEWIKLLEMRETEEGSYMIRFLCRDKQTGDDAVSDVFVHRLSTFQEELEKVKEVFGLA